MNYLWAFMILIGIVYGACTGNMQGVADAALSSAQEAVELALTMCGVMALWVGLMEIAQKAGLVEKMSRGIRPFLNFLFPNLPEDHAAREYISTNIIANFLGLGWAATPAGLKAMEALADLEEERRAISGKRDEEKRTVRSELHQTGQRDRHWISAMPRGAASNEMCTFLIINISSLQLIPVNIIAYRSQYGSVNPTAVVGPAILATAVSTLAGVIFCKVMDRKKRSA
ncbi:MAG: nucleoside recognition protein [Lachnospiraceae bacterium]|nr:nucleoside recognition protein [Lachnospiraceae bacterium]